MIINNPVDDHDVLAGVSADDHHNESHTVASHSDTTATGAETETLTDGSTDVGLHTHGATVAELISLVDGSTDIGLHTHGATVAENQTLVGGGNADSLHSHLLTANGLEVIHKGSAETVNNSAVLQDDDDFGFSIAAGKTVYFDIYLHIDTPGLADFKCQMDGPAGITGEWGIIAGFGNTTGDYYSGDVRSGYGAPVGWIGTQTREAIHIRGTAIAAGTPGTLQLSWCQAAAIAGDTTVRAFSSGQALTAD
tara:strand:- start:7269 stop:8021 length:753 start_codon:yes stop_codon:yes gene_type:complete